MPTPLAWTDTLASCRPLIEYLRKFYYYDPEEEMYMSVREARRVPSTAQPTETQT